jgi:2,3-diketo-5-methylthio-1-phosphopentane phosphatase
MFAPDEWKEILDSYLRGDISSRICNIRLAKLIQPREEEARKMVYSIGIDPTFHHFVNWIEDKNVEMIIVSDGYDYYIDLLLQSEGLSYLTYFSNRMVWTDRGIEVEFPLYKQDCEKDMAHCKCQHVVEKEGARRVYIGDGVSDVCAATRCETIYAKRNLLDHCLKNHVPCTPFDDFHDVIRGEENFWNEVKSAEAVSPAVKNDE